MNTKNIYSAVYREKYFEGYNEGFNPFSEVKSKRKGAAFNSGYVSGRFDYQSMNGNLSEGIPNRIVTKKILEDFILAGMLGLSIDIVGYTVYQLNMLRKWYLSGVEMYDPNENTGLLSILEENNIEISNSF